MLTSLIIGKATIITFLSRSFGVPLAGAIKTGLLTSQGLHSLSFFSLFFFLTIFLGGEFAFVAFGIAQRLGVISSKLNKILLTTVALSMALTPWLAEIGSKLAYKIEQNQGIVLSFISEFNIYFY
jgi:Kef-type K+ transport system membrane component KefB